ncbi:MAG: OmpA family protein [Sandaracinaceae bacterium]|nr:OmpA family protein [Sandaracinaceae bacterium]
MTHRRSLVVILSLLSTLASTASASPELATWEGDAITLARPLEFEIDSHELRPQAMPVIESIRDRLRERPGVRVEIQGHTDPAWVCEHCGRRLTQDRAQAVLVALVRLGIDRDRLEARGYAGTRPRRLCDGLRRRARRACQVGNRRIEIVIRPSR